MRWHRKWQWQYKRWRTGEAEMFREIKQCRMCGKEDLQAVLDLGVQYVVDFVPEINPEGLRAPLLLVRCTGCGLVQLRHSVKKELLYTKFWYRSSISEQMREALKEIVDRAQDVAVVGSGDTVLDIGANDGTLLGWYPGVVNTVGIDPCAELIEEGLQHHRMDIGIKGFFSKEAVKPFGPFKVITAIAMFYDVEDPVQFLTDCKEVLKEDGVIIVQMNYLSGMLENCAFDNICHEHLTYFSMMTLKEAADRAGLEVVGAELNEVNGGSFRVYLTHKDSGLYGVSNAKQIDLFMMSMNLLHKEMKSGLDRAATYAEFGRTVMERCTALQHYLTAEAEKGAKIYVYGASTRGTVLMQVLNLSDGVLRGVAERDSNKYNLHMVGGNWVKIYPEAHCRQRATHFLVLPWHFRRGILEREQQWMHQGGKMIFPLPRPEVITDKTSTFIAVQEKAGVGA